MKSGSMESRTDDGRRIVNVAEQFTRYPAGRMQSDGPYSGETFREKLLRPALKGAGHVIVQLDGVMGYGSSFLEEAFGGLIRNKHIGFDELNEKMTIESDDSLLRAEIAEYIKDAHEQQASLER